MLSKKQQIIVNYLKSHDEMTKKKAIELIGFGIYYNQEKYVGETLRRMVIRNLIVRVRLGVYQLPSGDGNAESLQFNLEG